MINAFLNLLEWWKNDKLLQPKINALKGQTSYKGTCTVIDGFQFHMKAFLEQSVVKRVYLGVTVYEIHEAYCNFQGHFQDILYEWFMCELQYFTWQYYDEL